MQPDNFVQDIENTQNYNRYGYVLNNPLKYTDPSGEKWKIGWKDIVAGLQVVVGTVLLFVPGAQLIGGGLLLNGLSYFASTYDQYKVTGDWASASANSSIMFGYQTTTDWGYDSKNDKNGVTQSAPVVTPYSNIGSKGKEDNTESNGGLLGGLLGAYQWYNKHTTLNFKADLGFYFLRFKGYHYGVPEFETSFLNGQGAITPGSFALYPTGGASNPSYSTHEPGHALQYQILGRYYYPLIALPSIINTKLNWRIFDYSFFSSIQQNNPFLIQCMCKTN